MHLDDSDDLDLHSSIRNVVFVLLLDLSGLSDPCGSLRTLKDTSQGL